jgi:DNA polymerase III epsilon subunit-like protein
MSLQQQQRREIVFDTETTNIPPRKNGAFHDPSDYNAYNNCRLVSIAWKICTVDHIILDQYDMIIPVGFSIPQDSVAIHGITDDIASKGGSPLALVMSNLWDDIVDYDVRTIVAHNIEFDVAIVLSEMYRLGLNAECTMFKSLEKLCTMQGGMHLLKLKKYPKLVDLYTHFYPSDTTTSQNAHNAEWDTHMCYQCFKSIVSQS